MAKVLEAKGHDVSVFSAGSWPDNFSVYKIRTPGKPSFLSNILFAINSRAALKKESFDCILSFERTFYQDIYRAGDGCHREWLGKRGRVESIFKKISFGLNPHHIVLLNLEKRCLLNSRAIIANSIMVKNDIIKHYAIPGKKIHVIYNGVDLLRFRPVEREKKIAGKNLFNIKKQERVILFAGGDFRRKGLPALLKAFSLLNEKNARLVVAGKRPNVKYLSMAKKLGIEKKVTFTGPVREIEKLYSISDVFVLPTIYDPFSNATIEAMASGLPVITTAYNGASELIENGVHGFVIDDPSDSDSFAEKISSALFYAEDMGKQARLKAEEYPIDNAVDKIIRIISGTGG